MKKLFTCVSISILLFCTYTVNTEEIRFIHKIANEEYFTVQGKYTEQFGDSLMFWSVVVSPKPDSVKYYDSTQIDQFLMTYCNGTFDSIPLKKIKDFNFGNYNGTSQIVKDKHGDIIFGFNNGGLYRISKGKIIRYDSIVRAMNIKVISSLVVGDSNELYIHAGSRIMKFDFEKMDTIVDGSFDLNSQPVPLSFQCLYKINNRIYYLNYNNGISFFDIETLSVDSISLFHKLDSIIPDFMFVYPINQFENYFNLMLRTKASNTYYARFYPESDKIEMLDYIMDVATNENLPNDKLFLQGFDKNKNCYLYFQDVSLLDSIYVVSPDHIIRRFCLVSDSFPYHNGFNISKPSVLSNGDVIIPASRGLFVIPAEGTSIEAPKNWLFMNSLYPNPARDRIRVDFAVESINLGSTKLEIYDYLGRLAIETNPEVEYNSSTGHGTLTCDISKLRAGYYIAVLTNGKFSRSTPLFVE